MDRMPGRMAANLFFVAVSVGMLFDFSSMAIDFRLVGAVTLAALGLGVGAFYWFRSARRPRVDEPPKRVDTYKFDW